MRFRPPPTAVDAAAPRTAADENFPVASWLVASHLRPPIHAFYRFARTADEIADSPALSPDEKTSRLLAIEAALRGDGSDDPAVEPARALRTAVDGTAALLAHAHRLLQAFFKDAVQRRYRTWSDLMLYCRYSAAPVGRFVLDLHGENRATWRSADALCAALQVINHLQDCKTDYLRLDRVYLPLDWFRAAGSSPERLAEPRADEGVRRVLDRALDRVDELLHVAWPLPRLVRSRRLRLEVSVILYVAESLSSRLRRRDPLAGRVALSRAGRLWCAGRGIAAGLSP